MKLFVKQNITHTVLKNIQKQLQQYNKEKAEKKSGQLFIMTTTTSIHIRWEGTQALLLNWVNGGHG